MSRIDKYLWAIRVFKTRSEATDACNGNKVRINGYTCKPSKTVCEGDVLEIRKGPLTYTFKVLAITEARMGAALVPNYALNLTPQSELDKMRAPVETIVLKRDKGTGRPTKKERRGIDALIQSLGEDDF